MWMVWTWLAEMNVVLIVGHGFQFVCLFSGFGIFEGINPRLPETRRKLYFVSSLFNILLLVPANILSEVSGAPSMAMLTLKSTYNTNLSQTVALEKNNGSPCDASFSTFLSGAEENYVRKQLSESGRDLGPKISNQGDHHYSGRKKEEDGEIGVFGAEKYFNGGIDADSPRLTKIDAMKLECVKREGVNLEPIKPVIHQGIPSVRSESSWNSQSALLQIVTRNPPRPKANKVNGKTFLSGLVACKCYCSDRDSVDIEEQVGEISFKRTANGGVVQGRQNKAAASKASLEVNKPPAEPWIKEDLFTFPTMNSTVGIQPVNVPLQGEVDEIGRKSLEVFGSPVLGRRNKPLNLGRRLKMLSWDSNPKAEETENPKGNYNDTESDASSDLFEIESLTGKAYPFLARQASEAASGCVTPTTCYAPSEVSIEWSVVTASAADFSGMSDYEELRPSTTTLPSPIKTFSTTIDAKTKSDKEFQRRRSGGLLGCNSQKAVKVAEDAYKTNDKAGFEPRMRRVSDSYTPATRFRAETQLAGFEPIQTPRILATRSLPHPHSSPRASPLLYIQ
ncbi:Phytochrome kinase substrate 1, putative [Theobroma cacao]|uniref:Phytochrome kinase substrate 1, putative n=1 Tax=Theobroma cacao TaxID=3641 RepID=A0A061EI15_THECC|nr:Phytochrome kinase substrate 1, putative [Theobroma cacao]